MGTGEGVCHDANNAQARRRLSPCDPEGFRAIQTRQTEETERCEHRSFLVPEEPIAVMKVAAVPIVIKRHDIVRADLARYGFTASCLSV